MREKIRNLVIKAIINTNELTEVIDKLCVLSDVSIAKRVCWCMNKEFFGDADTGKWYCNVCGKEQT